MILKVYDRIRMRTVDYFNSFRVSLQYDSVASQFSFAFYFDPKNREHAELACVSHMHEAIVEHNGEVLITGYILSQSFNRSPRKELSQLAGYSKPGVFEDCDIPTDQYPLEIEGLTLKEIAQKIAAPFGIGVIVDKATGDKTRTPFLAGPPSVQDGQIVNEVTGEIMREDPTLDDKLSKRIEKVNAKESQNIKGFLTELAAQRNVVLSHDAKGNLVFTVAKTGLKPIAHFEDGLIDTHINVTYNGQPLHSHITVVKQADESGGNAGEVTIRNPYVPILYRPRVIVQTSGDDVDIELVAKQALAAELKNITCTISIDRWDINNKLIKPNNIITVMSPENFIYHKTKFFVEKVDYEGDAKKTTAVLTCVLPEVYNNNYPKNIFVDVHENFPRI